jgi:hypothetical protein
MKSVGLLSPVIWNEATGFLVSGHQRLSVLDDLEKYKPGENDYDIVVSCVQLNEKTEKEMVVFLNNPSAQGDWNLDKLADLKLTSMVSFEEMGFIQADVDILFSGDSKFSQLFHDNSDVTAAKDTLKKIKEVRSSANDKFAGQNSADYYFTVVCDSQEDKQKLMQVLGAPMHDEFVNSDMIRRRLDVNVE